MTSRKSIHNVLPIVFILITTLSCVASDDNARELTQEMHYEFNPNNIIDSIATGNTDAFLPIDKETAWYEGGFIETPVKLTQDDYFLVAKTVIDLLHNGSQESWGVNSMSFGLMCDEVDYGPQNASFTFVPNNLVISNSSDKETVAYIYPRSHQIDVFEYAYSNGYNKEGVIDTGVIRKSAGDVLMIAENNGAYEKRKIVSNDCEISIILSLKENRPIWDINYFPDIYSLSIDAVTGSPVN